MEDALAGRRGTTVRGTKRHAEAMLAEILAEADKGVFVKLTKLTLGAFHAQWLRDYVGTNVRPRTAEGYHQYIERHIKPRLGQIVLNSAVAKW